VIPSAKEPYNSAKEPNVSAKDADIFGKKATKVISIVKESNVSANESDVSATEATTVLPSASASPSSEKTLDCTHNASETHYNALQRTATPQNISESTPNLSRGMLPEMSKESQLTSEQHVDLTAEKAEEKSGNTIQEPAVEEATGDSRTSKEVARTGEEVQGEMEEQERAERVERVERQVKRRVEREKRKEEERKEVMQLNEDRTREASEEALVMQEEFASQVYLLLCVAVCCESFAPVAVCCSVLPVRYIGCSVLQCVVSKIIFFETLC